MFNLKKKPVDPGDVEVNGSVLAAITNYDFSDNADNLKKNMSVHFQSILIDSSSPIPPALVDVSIPNQYYVGLWNESVRLAIAMNKSWLLFLASDVLVPDMDLLAERIKAVVRRGNKVGVYTASLRHDSRIAYEYCYNRATASIREGFLCEGFFFLARTELLKKLYPVEAAYNKYGWGVDVAAACRAYEAGFKVVVDDLIEIYHPPSIHPISLEVANQEVMSYLGKVGALTFFERAKAVVETKKKLSAVLGNRLASKIPWPAI